MGTELCKDKNKSTRICCSCSVRCRGGCAMANFLLLPSFHLKNLPGSFSALCRETVVVATAAAVVAARKRLANNLPIKADLVSNLVSAFFRAGAGAEGAGRQASSGCICASQTGAVGAARAGRDAGELAGTPGSWQASPTPASPPALAFLVLSPAARALLETLEMSPALRPRLASPTECPARARCLSPVRADGCLLLGLLCEDPRDGDFLFTA